MELVYKTDVVPTPEQIVELYENAGLPRPTQDIERIGKMYANANLIISAWNGNQLVGVSRAITDWVWCCYLADLAVRQDYKATGIGKQLVKLTKEKAGEQSMVLLLSVPTAMEYYPKIGMEKVDNGFIIFREK
ncbi:GNAT family N-acetyltransferase [Emticicia sp. BO119]|uniref:GNAT family N-acetyltransferase n=1 Tax=Emticicia sp. BO119 TaxID=2757768 RepID=UPI0015F058DB|nr:GNAT family N-acetyltransferase [Emticicia sp. BO119]MBA4850668.1 GNAT family N-acetyltransferase [Emticicia sp. BO119]